MCTIVRTCVLCFLVSGAVGTFDKEVLFFSYEAFLPFMLCSTCAVGFSPHGEFRNWAFFLFSFPPFRWSGVEGGGGGGLGMHLVFCPGGLPLLPLDLGPVRGVGVLLDFCLLRASTLSLHLLLRELAKGELLVCSGLFCAHYTPRLTFDDVGNCGSLRRFATRFILSWFPI